MQEPGGRSRDEILGRHDATLESHQREMTDLKGRQVRAGEKLESALKEFRAATMALKEEAWKTKWMRRGAFLMLSAMFTTAALVVRYYPDLAEAVLHWVISHSSTTH